MLRLSTLLAAFIFAAAVFSAAQNSIQPPIWASKPDVAAFERTVKDRIAGAQSSIEKVTAVKGSRNIENTLAPFDDAVRLDCLNVGAMVGGVCTNNFGTSAAAVAAGILLIILAVVIRETRQLERRAAGATVEAGAEEPA